MSDGSGVGGTTDSRMWDGKHMAAVRRRRRLAPGAIGLCLLMVVASCSMLAAPNARAAGTGSSPEPSPNPRVMAPGGNNSGVQPLTNTVYYTYNWVGYNGNGTIYPTKYAPVTDLPGTNVTAYQSSSNDSNLALNMVTLTTDDVGDGAKATQPSDYQWDTSEGNHGAEQVNLGLAATTVSQQYECFNNCPAGGAVDVGYVGTPYIALKVDATNLPSSTTNEFKTENDTGANITTGIQNETGNGGSWLLSEFIGVALLAGIALAPEEMGPTWVFDVGDVAANSVGVSGVYQGGQYSDSIQPPAGSTIDLTQWTNADNGTWLDCGSPCASASSGKNLVSAAEVTTMYIYSPNTVTTTSISLSAVNSMQYSEYESGVGELASDTGAIASYSYPVEPAASLEGFAHFWSGAGAPPAPATTLVTVQQQQTSGNVFWDYNENPSPGGYYHVFVNPDVDYTQWWTTFSNALGTTTNATGPVPYSDWNPNSPYDAEGHDQPYLNTSVDGGILRGTVTAGGSPAVGSIVQLCDSSGCVSDATNSSGGYLIDVPRAITEGSIHVTDPPPLYSDYNYGPGLGVSVGQYNTYNIALSKDDGGPRESASATHSDLNDSVSNTLAKSPGMAISGSSALAIQPALSSNRAGEGRHPTLVRRSLRTGHLRSSSIANADSCH
jgi:hypothetical protein